MAAANQHVPYHIPNILEYTPVSPTQYVSTSNPTSLDLHAEVGGGVAAVSNAVARLVV